MWLHWCRRTGRDSASRCARSSAPKRNGRALGELGDPHGRSVRDLTSLIDVRERPLGEAEMGWVQDIDTPDDLRKARSGRAMSRVAAPSPGTDWSTINEARSQAHDANLDRRRVHGAEPAR